MRHQLRQLRPPRPTYANVVATLALFVALGGGAYAVGLDKRSVGSKHLRPGAVKAKKLAANAVRSPKVADGSLRAADFAAGELPEGATGPAGGDLTGTYPAPRLAPGVVGAAQVAADALGGPEINESSLRGIEPEGLAPVPAVRALKRSAQDVASGSFLNPIGFEIEEFDTRGMHEPGAENDRLVAPIGGVYAISGHVASRVPADPGSQPGSRRLAIYRGTSDLIAFEQDEQIPPDLTHQQSIATIARLEAGDYVQLRFAQTGGIGGRVLPNGPSLPAFAMTWLGPIE